MTRPIHSELPSSPVKLSRYAPAVSLLMVATVALALYFGDGGGGSGNQTGGNYEMQNLFHNIICYARTNRFDFEL